IAVLVRSAGADWRKGFAEFVLALLMSFQDLAGALDHAVRQAGEPGNFDTVAFISAAGLDAAQENDLAGRLLRGDVDVLHRREKVGKLCQFVIMRCEMRTRADVLLDMLYYPSCIGQIIECFLS